METTTQTVWIIRDLIAERDLIHTNDPVEAARVMTEAKTRQSGTTRIEGIIDGGRTFMLPAAYVAPVYRAMGVWS